MTTTQAQIATQATVSTITANPGQTQLKLMLSVSCGMFLLLMQPIVQAEALKDPTQPPASFSSELANGSNPAPSGPVLQSVMIGTQLSAAIINGQKVLLGKKYEQATLISVNENQAVLRNQDGSTLILKMEYAGMKKTLSPAKSQKNNSNNLQR